MMKGINIKSGSTSRSRQKMFKIPRDYFGVELSPVMKIGPLYINQIKEVSGIRQTR